MFCFIIICWPLSPTDFMWFGFVQVLIYSPDGRCLSKYQAYESGLGVKSVSWSPCSQFLAVGSYDQMLRVLNHLTWKVFAEFVHPSAVRGPCCAAIFKVPNLLFLSIFAGHYIMILIIFFFNFRKWMNNLICQNYHQVMISSSTVVVSTSVHFGYIVFLLKGQAYMFLVQQVQILITFVGLISWKI